jgi:parallel beta-helix repeat protein
LFDGIWLIGDHGESSGNTIAHCSASDNGNSGIAIEPP